MAEVKEEIKTDNEVLQEGDDLCSDPLSLASDVIPKTEIKEELYDFYESDNSLHFDDFLIKPEKVDISDVECSSKRKESEGENDQRHEIQEATKTLECAACSSTFSDKATLTRHVNSRCVESLCRPCSVILERLESRTKARAAAVFSCPLCNIGFTSKLRRDRHQRLSCRRRSFNEPLKTTLTYEEPKLAKKITEVFELSAKLNEPAPECTKRFMCAVCSYSTDRSSNFKTHLATHTGERRFACTMCEYKATQKGSVTRHLLTHGDVKPFACTVCNFRAVLKHHLTKHMRSHSRKIPLKCTQCDYVSKHSNNLARHVRAKHTKDQTFGSRGRQANEPESESKKRFNCSDCFFATYRRDSFKDHLATHTGERRFPCTMCEYKGTRKASLTRHLLTHGDVKPFACAECNYRAVLKGNLARHMLLHSREKPFKCDQCVYASNLKNTLAIHVRARHTDERPYACTQCEYTCVTSSHLASHMSKHGADKKLSCPECSYQCNQSGHLKSHMLKHRDDIMLSCLHCKYKSNFAANMKRHVAAKHNG